MTSSTVVDPWGGEVAGPWVFNTAQQRRKFTTYERDSNYRDEAMQRQYHGFFSRFDQPDPSDASYDLTDPQSFNRYAYTNNDPVNYTDPTGLNRFILLDGMGGGWSYGPLGVYGGYATGGVAGTRTFAFFKTGNGGEVRRTWTMLGGGGGGPVVTDPGEAPQNPNDEKQYQNCVNAINRKYNGPPSAPDSEAGYELEKNQLLELFALKLKQNTDKTYFQIGTTFTGAIVGWAWAGTRAGSVAGLKGVAAGAVVGALIGTGIKIGDQIFGDHQVQEEFQLRARHLAEKYPNAAARDAYFAARDAELADCERFMRSN